MYIYRPKTKNSICLYAKSRYISLHSQQGFTLIEMLITVSILTILITMAVPSVTNMLASQEAKTIRQAIENGIREAKAESLSRRHDIHLCLTNRAGSCDKEGSNELLLFIDNDGDNTYSAANDTLITKHALTLKYATTHLRASSRNYIRFAGDNGTPRGFMGHIKYCPIANSVQQKYKVSFSMTGKVTYKPDSVAEPTDCASS